MEDMAAFWKRQLLVAREYASTTIIPACKIVVDIANSAKNLIDKEALLESMGSNGSTGPKAAAALLTARASASSDPSAIPSICRVSAALQYPAGLISEVGTSGIFICQDST